MSLVINIDDIPEDEEYKFDLVAKPDYFKVDPEEGILRKDVSVCGRLSKAGREVFLKGTISTEIEQVCSRCLEPHVFPVQAALTSHYVPAPEELETDMELHSSDTDVEFFNDNRIDMTQAVYDQMLLSLPLVQLCREDCKGICSKCGINRNKEECGCLEEDSIDPRLAVLKTLKDKLK